MSAQADGPVGWALDIPDNPAEQICARCNAEYQEIFNRLGTAIGQMQARGDGDALRLLSMLMQVAVNDITDFIKSKPVQVVP